MLNKEICKKCVNKMVTICKWNESDEIRWKNNKIHCPHMYRDSIIMYITNDMEHMPSKCPYRLEQIVSAQTIQKICLDT